MKLSQRHANGEEEHQDARCAAPTGRYVADRTTVRRCRCQLKLELKIARNTLLPASWVCKKMFAQSLFGKISNLNYNLNCLELSI